MVDVLALSVSMTATPTPTSDVLAERFAAAAHEQGQSAEVLDLTAIGLPLFTPRA